MTATHARVSAQEVIRIVDKGRCDYRETWEAMREFTRERHAGTADEVWILEHAPVYTQGTSCHDQPGNGASGIPVIHTDRGGQITYHGPGQLVAYLLLDIKRRKTGPKSLVNAVEQLVIDYLADFGINAGRRPGAPGVYVGERKIAALGLRISGGCSYHGLSLNVDMDLSPFGWIDPCGFPGLAVTQMVDLVPGVTYERAKLSFIDKIKNSL